MNIQEKIELYIEGLLNKDEIIELENMLMKDDDLAHEVKQRKKLFEMLKKKMKYSTPSLQSMPHNDLSKIQELSIDDDLNEFLYHYKGEITKGEEELIRFLKKKKAENSPKTSKGFNFYFSIAASLIFLLILSISVKKIVSEKIKENLSQAIFNDYYQPDSDQNLIDIIPDELTFIDNNLILNATGEKVGKGLNFENLRTGENKYEEVMNFSIICIQNNKFQIATSNLETILDSKDEKISLMAQWYYSLIQIKLKNFETASEYLRKIEKSNSVYSSKAGEVLVKLNE